jgi:hypothetical protein
MARRKDAMRARAHQRNTRAFAVSGGLMAFAILCLVMFVTGFASLGASRADKRPTSVVKSTTTRATTRATTPATTVAPTTTSTTTTVAPTTTSTTTTTVAPTTTTLAPTTTTTVKRVRASVTISNRPDFCTVTVHLSTGAFRSFRLAEYLAQPGDARTFNAFVGGYHVDVSARVVGSEDDPQCRASLKNLRR